MVCYTCIRYGYHSMLSRSIRISPWHRLGAHQHPKVLPRSSFRSYMEGSDAILAHMCVRYLDSASSRPYLVTGYGFAHLDSGRFHPPMVHARPIYTSHPCITWPPLLLIQTTFVSILLNGYGTFLLYGYHHYVTEEACNG